MLDADNPRKGGRLVMLGTPNYGSFAIPRLLYGINDVLNTLARINLPHLFNKDVLLECVKTFVGSYQMMPVRGKTPGLDALYSAATYTRRPVRQAHLDDAWLRAIKQHASNGVRLVAGADAA